MTVCTKFVQFKKLYQNKYSRYICLHYKAVLVFQKVEVTEDYTVVCTVVCKQTNNNSQCFGRISDFASAPYLRL